MGYLLAFTAIFLWSFNIIIASYFATTLLPLELSLGRWLVGGAILIPLVWKKLRRDWPILKQHLWFIFSLGVTGIALSNTLIYYAGETASPINMGLLGLTGPIFLIILSRLFLNIRIRIEQILGILIALFGVVSILVRGDFAALSQLHFAVGDWFMLINAFCFAVYSFLQTKRPQQVSQETLLAATVIAGVIILLPLTLATVSWQKLTSLNAIDWAVFIYLGIFNSVLAYLCWNYALNKIGNVKTGVIYYLLPILSGIEAYFLLGEQIYRSQLWGGALIILGIALTTIPKRLKPLPEHKNSA